ncbi:hypothetical protein MGYG_04550 [Nannizzia gypsea CBS 118893]|uniref:Uncharacterized protein n=1 Tax=Arthroderma gypseum (strain ATCC MYA-4604 / CBS 118893) TaxID=535722 RepID=E4UTQ5_ARTGP|nr:hypothetical protein MGYG_04550 [Nannizzia gypsea CBS 118893]EFR01548.1 hypothetical protein MGYG_04550 [Nannizzia gypsea CBS 118893]
MDDLVDIPKQVFSASRKVMPLATGKNEDGSEYHAPLSYRPSPNQRQENHLYHQEQGATPYGPDILQNQTNLGQYLKGKPWNDRRDKRRNLQCGKKRGDGY